uniref:Peptidase C1A papain C-terminal domain-containing protein n=1 Tax=Chromera velia CCMP2878 TaxID=1169474 RepID=A0A0G4GUB3_9ALVE|mmetsp:Transcript_26450/g.51944  ORF Transcript_26450/g.51944 Transcript_26450/m.51944 type:complete len:503 (-) Transcript_26450:1295-2803(-)|eukprot:Cvel_5218.t1-p1 / transcript=Cvel_5218.t1 / gene=Cvel_5218 / organism=Chromera_velia_CCMP2878 / gene_product=Fruit bromelain, putative / transcript_product=Fruit bromelain, putative / location=Cvel_scaffold240:63407-65455(+) / protein_length=502 / sequence_SO=supercontig / SO=protein_coding / is_pseudo=false
MFKRFVLQGVALAAVVTAQEDMTFDEFVMRYQKGYASPEERAQRKAVFEENAAWVKAHNADPSSTWVASLNRFSDITPEEWGQGYMGVNTTMLGAFASMKHKTDMFINFKEGKDEDAPEKIDLSALPARVDWRDSHIVAPVKEQGLCGSCWAFASISTIESYWAKATGSLTELSEQQILDCSEYPPMAKQYGIAGCQGGLPEMAYETALKMGALTSEWTYPYLSYRGQNRECLYNMTEGLDFTGQTGNPFFPSALISGYKAIQPNSYDEVMFHLAHHGPLTLGVDASRWKFYRGGVFNNCPSGDEPINLNHAVNLVGYGTDEQLGPYWLIRNSWGATWGEQGYMRIKRTTPEDFDFCGTMTVQVPDIPDEDEEENDEDFEPDAEPSPSPEPEQPGEDAQEEEKPKKIKVDMMKKKNLRRSPYGGDADEEPTQQPGLPDMEGFEKYFKNVTFSVCGPCGMLFQPSFVTVGVPEQLPVQGNPAAHGLVMDLKIPELSSWKVVKE